MVDFRAIRGAKLAPLDLPAREHGDLIALRKAFAGISCEELVRRIFAYTAEHAEIPEIQVSSTETFAVLRPDGQLFVLAVFGPPSSLSVMIVRVGAVTLARLEDATVDGGQAIIEGDLDAWHQLVRRSSMP